MSEKTWARVDDYIEAKLLPSDPVQQETLRRNADEGLPAIELDYVRLNIRARRG